MREMSGIESELWEAIQLVEGLRFPTDEVDDVRAQFETLLGDAAMLLRNAAAVLREHPWKEG